MTADSSGDQSASYRRGDWITLRGDPVTAGVRAVVVDVRVTRMTVAYLDMSGRVSTRDVRISDARPGHQLRGRGLQAITQDFERLKVEAAQDVTDFAVVTGRLTVTDAAELLEAFQQMATDRLDADAERAVAEEQRVLSRWLEGSGEGVGAGQDSSSSRFVG